MLVINLNIHKRTVVQTIATESTGQIDGPHTTQHPQTPSVT